MNKYDTAIFVLRYSPEIREHYENERGLITEEFINQIKGNIDSIDSSNLDSLNKTINSIIEDGLKNRVIGEEVENTKYFEII
ncbi:hypothetical protein UR09_00315 [Candidatus Nitromaritima sp. SCGC AAA799-A02]|nr:hypothetical protein UR09_00315 [Candidatus Nitromaritima sp. SCGC AAA799-A02]